MPIRLTALAAALLVSAPLLPAPASQVRTGAQPATYVYNGTVHIVRTELRTLDVITAVGPALRMVHMAVPSSAVIEIAGRRVTLSDLKPGDVIHAECRLGTDGMIAEKIQKSAVEDTRGAGEA